MNDVTQEELDWLTEGELEQAERQQLFTRLDQQEDGWKRCALALLEHQALQTSLSASFDSESTILLSDASGASSTMHGTLECLPPVKQQAPFSSRKFRTTTVIQWVLVAGIAGVCFLTGYLVSNSDHSSKDGTIANSEVQPSFYPNQNLRDQLASSDPQMVLAVNQAVHRINVKDRELIALVSVRNNNQDLLLPVIRSKTLSRRFAESPGPSMSKNWATQLTKAGWDLKPHREFLSLHLPDGTNQVLPVNLMNCRYVGKPIL